MVPSPSNPRSHKQNIQQVFSVLIAIIIFSSPPSYFLYLISNMDDRQELQLHVRGTHGQQNLSQEEGIDADQPQLSTSAHWKWWLIVALNIFFLLSGQTVATLLGRLYFDQGGNSTWMATIVQSAGVPLVLPLLLLPSPHIAANSYRIAFIYIFLGLLLVADNLMYSYGLLYLPVSTYALICASQLAFNAIFSHLLNSQKFTALILNSVVFLTFSAALLGIRSGSSESTSISGMKYLLGFILTLAASAVFSLNLSLTQLTLEKVLKKPNFYVVFEMMMATNTIATIAAVVGLFASGEWRGVKGEMEGFKKGRVAYVMTLVWTAVSWQVASAGMVGLIFLASSLFSNAIGTVALPLVPIFAVVFFGDSMDGVKVMAMVIAIWGFLSYGYQLYLDESKGKREEVTTTTSHGVNASVV